MSELTTEQRIKTLLTREAMVEGDPNAIDDGAALIEDLALDSIQIVELIGAIEDEFDIVMDDDELTLEVFESVRSLAQFVKQKTDS